MTISEKNETFDVIIGDATAENTKTPFEAIVKTDEKNIQNEIYALSRKAIVANLKSRNGYCQLRAIELVSKLFDSHVQKEFRDIKVAQLKSGGDSGQVRDIEELNERIKFYIENNEK